MEMVWRTIDPGLVPEDEARAGKVHSGVMRQDVGGSKQWRVVYAVRKSWGYYGESWDLKTDSWLHVRHFRTLELALQDAARLVKQQVGGGRFQFFDREGP